MPFLDLALHEPSLLLDFVLADASPATVGALECSCRGLRQSVRHSAWQAMLRRRWAVEAEASAAKPLLQWLETVVRMELRQSVGRGFEQMHQRGLLAAGTAVDAGGVAVGGWEPTAHSLLGWLPMPERRRIAAFVCAEIQPLPCLRHFLGSISLKGSATPEEALRRLLLRFPFLPIDAGSGADRIIGQFALNWIADNPGHVAGLGLHPDAPLKAKRDAVYSLTYSIIMLNTDLHNPAVWPKITAEEYADSCHRCVDLLQVPTEQLTHIHERIRTSPLQICAHTTDVETFIRSDAAGEHEIGAQVSIHTSLPHLRQLQRGSQQPLPKMDWAVAYYNVVDMLRSARVSVMRGAQRTIVRAWTIRALWLGALLAVVAAHVIAMRLTERAVTA